jgi:hypothetical protein
MAYERFMGRWSALVGQKFCAGLPFPGPPLAGPGLWHRRAVEAYSGGVSPQAIIAVDSSSDFIGHARRSIASPAVDFKLGQAQSLDVGIELG